MSERRAHVSALFMNKFRRLGFISYNGHLEVHSSLLSVVLADHPPVDGEDKIEGEGGRRRRRQRIKGATPRTHLPRSVSLGRRPRSALADCLVRLAFGLKLVVAGELTDCGLGGALGLVGRALDPVVVDARLPLRRSA